MMWSAFLAEITDGERQEGQGAWAVLYPCDQCGSLSRPGYKCPHCGLVGFAVAVAVYLGAWRLASGSRPHVIDGA